MSHIEYNRDMARGQFISVRVTEGEKRNLAALAAEEGISLSDWVRQAVFAYSLSSEVRNRAGDCFIWQEERPDSEPFVADRTTNFSIETDGNVGIGSGGHDWPLVVDSLVRDGN